METGSMWGGCGFWGDLVPSSPWEHLCFSPMSHPPPPPKEQSEEEEVQPGWMGVAGVVGSLHRAGTRLGFQGSL